jgi:hypothetical protein
LGDQYRRADVTLLVKIQLANNQTLGQNFVIGSNQNPIV